MCCARSVDTSSRSISTKARVSPSVQSISAVGVPPGSEHHLRRSGGTIESKTSGCSDNAMPCSAMSARNASGVRRSSIAGSFAPGQLPMYVMCTPWSPYAARTYRAVATGGETSDTRNGARSGPGASRRDRTNGHTHMTAGPRSRAASRRTVSLAMSSSPQLTGTAMVNPRRRHACANCTGVAGAAANTASLPMIATVETGRGSTEEEGAGM